MTDKPYKFTSFHEGFEKAKAVKHTVVGTVTTADGETTWKFYPGGSAERV